MRSQAVALPRVLPHCAQAFAAGDIPHGEALLPRALGEVAPLVERTVARRLVNAQDREDASQSALMAVMGALRKGVEPDVTLLASQAASQLWRTCSGMGDARGMSPDERSAVSNRVDADDVPLIAHGEELAEAIEMLDAERLARMMPRSRPRLATVVRRIADGFTLAETARALRVDPKAITRDVDEIRELVTNRGLLQFRNSSAWSVEPARKIVGADAADAHSVTIEGY